MNDVQHLTAGNIKAFKENILYSYLSSFCTNIINLRQNAIKQFVEFNMSLISNCKVKYK